ncbi:hypothetical protein WJX72_012107 [[Myrmecia] bisecta]|uniref:Protein kinase domain-containing protein n=1 Tax=[Myrmecia] bisecta TaxID=41462 RepID=A0AAW1RB10_9CHLO
MRLLSDLWQTVNNSRLLCCLSVGGSCATLDNKLTSPGPQPVPLSSTVVSKLARRGEVVCRVTCLSGDQAAIGANKPTACQADSDAEVSGNLQTQLATHLKDALSSEQPFVPAKCIIRFPGFRVVPRCTAADISPGLHLAILLLTDDSDDCEADYQLNSECASVCYNSTSALCSYAPVCGTNLLSWLGEPVPVFPESGFRRSTVLGFGGFGRVWLTESAALGSSVGLKKMRRSARDCTHLLAEEICAHFSLRHPNIVACHGAVVDTEGHLVGVVLESMEGGSLASLLRRTMCCSGAGRGQGHTQLLGSRAVPTCMRDLVGD